MKKQKAKAPTKRRSKNSGAVKMSEAARENTQQEINEEPRETNANSQEVQVVQKKRKKRSFKPPPKREAESLDYILWPETILPDEMKLFLDTPGETIATLLIHANNKDAMALERLVMLITKSVDYLNQIALEHPEYIRDTAAYLMHWPVLSGLSPIFNKQNEDLFKKIGLATNKIEEGRVSSLMLGKLTTAKKWAHDLILLIDECRTRIKFFKPFIPASWDPSILETDIASAHNLIKSLTTQSDPLSKYIWDRLCDKTKRMLEDPNSCLEAVKSALAAEFNVIIRLGPLYEESRFAEINIPVETLALRNDNLLDDELIRFNRFLMEDAYPGAFKGIQRKFQKRDLVHFLNPESLKQLESMGVDPDFSEPPDSFIPVKPGYLTQLFSGELKASSSIILKCLNLSDIAKNPDAWWDVAYDLLMLNTHGNPQDIQELREIGMVRADHISGLDFKKSAESDRDVFDPKGVENNIRCEIFRKLQDAFLTIAHQFKIGGSFYFTVDDFVNFPSLRKQLLDSSNRLSKFLWEMFSPRTRRILRNPMSNVNEQKLTLIEEFNNVVDGGTIYHDKRFKGVVLSEATVNLKCCLEGMDKPRLVETSRLNRLLLEDAFSQQIGRNYYARLVE